ncbi:hypothetical protein [Alicyclobacillus sp. SP_1]|uniref:hypothetical protein n=1 Tax=Alicyclobacillus sp. SP_1 TaxID=2942475 RepID=UPI002157642E|nr:hypothetical protein [Alicyclobacillus sp. SP_1]
MKLKHWIVPSIVATSVLIAGGSVFAATSAHHGQYAPNWSTVTGHATANVESAGSGVNGGGGYSRMESAGSGVNGSGGYSRMRSVGSSVMGGGAQGVNGANGMTAGFGGTVGSGGMMGGGGMSGGSAYNR